MPYRGIQLTPKPASEQPGDIFPIDMLSGTVVQIRGATVIQTWSVSFPGVLLGDVPPIPEPSDTFRWLLCWEEKKVPGTNVSCTAVTRDTGTGVIYFNFSDGSQDEVASLAALEAIADSIDAEISTAKNYIKGRAFRLSPDATNLAAVVGDQVAINLAPGVSQVVVYTPAE